MSSNEEMKKKVAPPPKLFTTTKALKLAELWVSKMSKSFDDDKIDEEVEGRVPRLGIGAKVPRQNKIGLSNDPAERKLQAKLNHQKRRDTRNNEETLQSKVVANDDDEDEESESRSSAFTKRKVAPSVPALPAQKKKKKKKKQCVTRSCPFISEGISSLLLPCGSNHQA